MHGLFTSTVASVVSFVAQLRRAREVLREEGRLSLRGLARELEIEGERLDEIIEELVEVQQVHAAMDAPSSTARAFQLAPSLYGTRRAP